MRTALGRARRLLTLLLLALSAWYLFFRRQVSPPALVTGLPAAEPGGPGELPADVLATDAGLTELPATPTTTGEVTLTELLTENESTPGTPTESLAGEPPEQPGDPSAGPGAVPGADDPAGSLAAGGDPSAFLGAGPVGVSAADEPGGVLSAGADPSADPGGVPGADDPAGALAAGGDPGASPADEPTVADLLAGPAVDVEVVEVVEVVDVVVVAEADTVEVYPLGTDGVDEPTSELPRPVFAETPSPAFSDAPTMEMPVLMDNLRAIRGIGPSMERMLHGLGIVSFRQLALLDGADLERVRDELRDFRTRIEREDWMGQARQQHRDKYGIDPT